MLRDGDSFSVDWLVDSSRYPALTQDLSATSTWSVDFLSSSQIQLDVSLTNTTTLAGLLTNADITTLGFGVNPDATATFNIKVLFLTWWVTTVVLSKRSRADSRESMSASLARGARGECERCAARGRH